MKKITILTMVAALAVITAASGCYVAPSGYGTTSYSYGGYTPYYYYGNLVYFDAVGRPYYYNNGYRVWVPSTWTYYYRARTNWRTNRYRYARWHNRYHRRNYWRRPVRHRGYRRHTYRRSYRRPVHHRRTYRRRRVY